MVDFLPTLDSDGGPVEAQPVVLFGTNGVAAPPARILQFGETLAANRTPIIELNSAYGISLLRDVENVSNSAEITKSATGEILLSTGATASSVARLDSAARIRYIPGYSCETGVGVRIPVAPTGNKEIKWGLRNPGAAEGIYYGMDASGVYAEVLRNSVATTARQSSWNIDKLDGAGPSGITLDTTQGTIFQIAFTWYGYGQILFGVIATMNHVQSFWPVHSVKIDGTTSVQTPNLPIFVEATNGADASDIDVYVGGRQASILGQYIPKYRITGQERGAVSTTTTTKPLVSFRNKDGFEDRAIRVANVLASATSNDHVLEIYINSTLTGATWVNPTNKTAAETSLETDVSATAISGGTLIFSTYVEGGQANKSVFSDRSVDFDVPENQVVTVAARSVTGTGTATAFFQIEEEW